MYFLYIPNKRSSTANLSLFFRMRDWILPKILSHSSFLHSMKHILNKLIFNIPLDRIFLFKVKSVREELIIRVDGWLLVENYNGYSACSPILIIRCYRWFFFRFMLVLGHLIVLLIDILLILKKMGISLNKPSGNLRPIDIDVPIIGMLRPIVYCLLKFDWVMKVHGFKFGINTDTRQNYRSTELTT